MENASIITFIEFKLRDLYLLWDDIGLQNEDRQEKMLMLSKDIKDIFDNMISNESTIRDQISKKIEEKLNLLNEILDQIGGDLVSTDSYGHNITLYDRLKKVEEELNNYQKVKQDKIKLFTDALESVLEISRSINEEDTTISFLNKELGDTASSLKISSFNICDLKNDTLKKILNHKEELLYERERRIKEFESLNRQIETLCDILGEDITYFKYNCIHSCECDDITKEYSTHNVVLNDSVKELSTYSLETLKNFVHLLSSIKEHRINLIQSYRLKIEKIAEKLNEEKLDINNFTDDITLKSLNIYRSVIHKLEEKKNIYIKTLIDQSFEKIKSYWEDLSIDIDVRQRFIMKYMNQYNDQVLDELDIEVDRLEKLSVKARPIKALIKERITLLEMKEKLDNPDPKRLLDNNKNSTFLLEEEKMRKRIKNELPTITKKLIKYLKVWEQENEGEPFIYQGESYLKKIMKEIDEEKKKKDNLKTKKELERSKRLGFTQSNGENNQNVVTPLKTPIKKVVSSGRSSITPMKVIDRTPLKSARKLSDVKGNITSSQQTTIKTPLMKRKNSDQGPSVSSVSKSATKRQKV